MSIDRATAVIQPLGKAVRRTYKATIYESLHELIQELALPPGERLIEADLAARFGVSKTPIREALLHLESDGLVTIIPHAGATVTWLSLEDYEQQLFLQDALEQPALPLIIERITSSELDAIARLIEEIRMAYARRDPTEYHRMVRRMHDELFATARYPRLTLLIGTVMQWLRRYHPVFVRPFSENWNRELEIITQRVEHIRAGDPAGAAAAVQQGHATMLDFARRLVEARDSRVMPYLAVRRDHQLPSLSDLQDGRVIAWQRQ